MDKIQAIIAPVMFSINDVFGVPFWIFYDRHEVKILVENLMANSEYSLTDGKEVKSSSKC